jgi:hypothetical protein
MHVTRIPDRHETDDPSDLFAEFTVTIDVPKGTDPKELFDLIKSHLFAEEATYPDGSVGLHISAKHVSQLWY